MKKLLPGLIIFCAATCGMASAASDVRSFFKKMFGTSNKKIPVSAQWQVKNQSARRARKRAGYKYTAFDRVVPIIPRINALMMPEGVNVYNNYEKPNLEALVGGERVENLNHGSDVLEANDVVEVVVVSDSESLIDHNQEPAQGAVVVENSQGNQDNLGIEYSESNQPEDDRDFLAKHRTKLMVIGGMSVLFATAGFAAHEKLGSFLSDAVTKPQTNKLKAAALASALTSLGLITCDYVINKR